MKKERRIPALRPRLVVGGCSRLADSLGVSRTHMSMVMHGTRRPGRALAARLRRLGVEWPMEGAGLGGGFQFADLEAADARMRAHGKAAAE